MCRVLGKIIKYSAIHYWRQWRIKRISMFHKFMKYSVFFRGRSCISRVHFIIWPCVLGKNLFLGPGTGSECVSNPVASIWTRSNSTSEASRILQIITGASHRRYWGTVAVNESSGVNKRNLKIYSNNFKRSLL